MKVAWRASTAAAGVLLAFAPLRSEILLSRPRTVEGVVVYPDDRKPSVFYFLPGELQISRNDTGPEFSFRRYRYLGTRAVGDAGVFRGRGIITFAVEFRRGREVLEKAEQALRKERGAITLIPVPIVKIQSELVYTSVEGAEEGRIEGGRWAEESPDESSHKKEKPASVEGVWRSRRYTVGLNILTTNLLWEAYQRKGVILSLNYSAVAGGKSDLGVLPEASAGDLPQSGTSAKTGLEDVQKAVLNGSLPIAVFPADCPACFKSVDIDAEMPAGYTFLDVYCYDFQEISGPADLFRKEVEIRGTSIDGSRPVQKAVFSASAPDIYKWSVHFPFAMNLEKGFDYRVVRVMKDGHIIRGEWNHEDSWTGILDMTDKPAESWSPTTKNKRKLY